MKRDEVIKCVDVGETARISLMNKFNYTVKIIEFCEDSLLAIDKFGLKVLFSYDDLARVEARR